MYTLHTDLYDFNCNYFGTMNDITNPESLNDKGVVIVACCDHFKVPNSEYVSSPRQFFTIQNLANSIPASNDPKFDSTLGSIEYALALMNVNNIVVCGHLDCKIIRHWSNRSRDVSGNNEVTKFKENACAAVKRLYPHATEHEKINLRIREHLLTQIKNLQSHSFVMSRLEEGSLKIHGWLVDDQSDHIYSYNPSRSLFGFIDGAPL